MDWLSNFSVVPEEFQEPEDKDERKLTKKQRQAIAKAKAKKKLEEEASSMPISLESIGKGFRAVDDAVRGAADTLTFGMADEIAGTLDRWTGLDTDGIEGVSGIEGQRARDEQGGKARMIGQIAGAIPLGVGAARLGLSPTARAITAGLRPSAMVLPAATEGAIYGGLYGAGSGEGAEDRVHQAVTGAGIGGAVGAGTPFIAPTAQSILRWAKNKIPGLQTVRPNALTPDQKQARRALTNTLDADGYTPQEALARTRELGPDAMLADVGPNASMDAQVVRKHPGAGRRVVTNRINDRQAGTVDRIDSMASDVMGPKVNTRKLTDMLIERGRQLSKPYYERAYKAAVPFNNRLRNLLQRDTMKKAYLRARGEASDEGYTDMVMGGQWVPDRPDLPDEGAAKFAGWIGDNGGPPMSIDDATPLQGKIEWGDRTPTVMELDYTKRALDRMIEDAKKAGKSSRVRTLVGLKNELTDIVDTSVPDYKTARELYRGEARTVSNIERGQRFFDSKTTVDDLGEMWKDMNDLDREAYRIGVRNQLKNDMGDAVNEALKAENKLRPRNIHEKLKIVFGEDEANKLLAGMGSEKTFQQTKNAVVGGSPTAHRLQGNPDLEGSNIPELNTGTLLRAIYNKMRGASFAGVRDEFGDLITRQGDLEQLLMEMDQVNMSDLQKRALLANFMRNSANPATADIREAVADNYFGP